LRRIIHSSLRFALGSALAVGLAGVADPTLRALDPGAPTIVARPETPRGDLALRWAKVVDDTSPSQVKQATPKDPRVWAPLIHQTYPREAAVAGLEGSVRIRVVVDEGGRVSDCVVLQSSGHGILDRAACDGMRRFAMFNPAIDASGSPTVGSYATIITYKMRTPQPQPPIVPGRSIPTT
jgi:protein TonB